MKMRSVLAGAVLAVAVISPGTPRAQDDHAAHHPPDGSPAASGAPSAAPAMGGASSAARAMGGASSGAPPMGGSANAAPATGGSANAAPAMGGAASGAPAMGASGTGQTGGMMGGMMAPPPSGGAGGAATPMYPSLMTLSSLTPQKRADIDALASQQVGEGMARLARGSESLSRATQAGDNAAMQQSVGMMREGLDELEAGISARRVLSEGKAPRNLALDWFKREMNLASPVQRDEPRALLGVAPFHLFTMVLLMAFVLAMVTMYVFKMRRAAALFGRLEGGSGRPPPGSSPPLASPPPAAPVAGSPPPAEASASPVSVATSSPLSANWRGQLRVESIVTETPSVKTFRLAPSSGDSLLPFTFVPGQFLNVAFWIGGAKLNRSYSISSSPTQRKYVELTVRREPRGAVSRHIDDLLTVGDQIEAGGPVGRFTFSGSEADSVVLISGGVGITPMMSIARYLTERSWSGDIFFVYTCRTPNDFIFADALGALQRLNPKLRIAVTMSGAEGTDWKGPRGRITKEWLTQTVPTLASRRIHLCGPPSMMESTKALLTEIGVAPDQVKTELFGATKPTPAAAGTSSQPTARATGPLVAFLKNNKSANIHVGQSVLELSEELAIGIEYSCRVGTCGVCKVKMTSGEVEMAVEDALDPDDKTNGIILACQAKPKSDVAVEA